MFEKSKWHNLLTVNAMLPFILETWDFLQKYLRFLVHYFFVNASNTVFSEVSIESLVKISNEITVLKYWCHFCTRCEVGHFCN